MATNGAAPAAAPVAVPLPPPQHTSFAARNIIPPNFAAFRPRDTRFALKDSCTCIAWSCDGKYLATCGYEKSVRIWEPEKSIEQRNTTALSGGHSLNVEHVAWNPTHPELLCSTSRQDMKVVFWDVRQTRPTQSLTVTRKPASLQYSPTGQTVFMIDEDDRLSFLHLGATGTEGKQEWRYVESARSSTGSLIAIGACWNHTGTALFLGCVDGTVKVVDYPSLELIDKAGAHSSGCYSLALDPRGKYLCTGGTDSVINFFDLSDWICVRAASPTDGLVQGLSFSHDGEYVAAATDSPSIDILSSETGLSLHRIPALSPVAMVAWHPSRHILASCGVQHGEKAGWMSLFGL